MGEGGELAVRKGAGIVKAQRSSYLPQRISRIFYEINEINATQLGHYKFNGSPMAEVILGARLPNICNTLQLLAYYIQQW